MRKSCAVKYFYVAVLLHLGFSTPLYAAEKHGTISAEKYAQSPLFKGFMRRIGNKVKNFQAEMLPSVETVFYPFGGPDLLYPLLLFPDATKFALVGLEKPGSEINFNNVEDTFLNLNSLLRRGFFVTADMGKSFKSNNGVRSALGLQILMLGGTIKNDELLDPNTTRIVFDWQGKEREVFYLRRDLVAQADSVAEFLATNEIHGACLMKAASYCPHRPMFNSLIEVILSNFDHILQDDTGIPYKKLRNFNIRVFGRYVEPYGKEWRGYEQPKLKELFNQKNDTPHLHFCYGYGCGRIEANMLLASRKKENSAQ